MFLFVHVTSSLDVHSEMKMCLTNVDMKRRRLFHIHFRTPHNNSVKHIAYTADRYTPLGRDTGKITQIGE